MYKDRIGLEKCLPKQQNKCRERHVQAAINAPQSLSLLNRWVKKTPLLFQGERN